MEDPTTTRFPGPQLRTREGRAYVAYGVWLRVALVGLFTAVAGVVQFVAGDAVPVLALAAAGSTIAYVGFRRAHAALGPAEVPAAVPQSAARRGGVRLADNRTPAPGLRV